MYKKVQAIGISACFLTATRYDARQTENNEVNQVLAFCKAYNIFILPFCPEQLGGLPTPRHPSEIQKGRVIDVQGNDVTQAFVKGAQNALQLLSFQTIPVALLKQKSPSCGYGKIYDGTFSGQVIQGKGFTASLLEQHGIQIFTEENVGDLLNILQKWVQIK